MEQMWNIVNYLKRLDHKDANANDAIAAYANNFFFYIKNVCSNTKILLEV